MYEDEDRDEPEFEEVVFSMDTKERVAQIAIWSGIGKVAKDSGLSMPQMAGIVHSIGHILDKMVAECMEGSLPKRNGERIDEDEAREMGWKPKDEGGSSFFGDLSGN